MLVCFFLFFCVITRAQHTNDSTIKTNSIDTIAVIDSLMKELQKDGLPSVPKKSYLTATLKRLRLYFLRISSSKNGRPIKRRKRFGNFATSCRKIQKRCRELNSF